MKLPSFIAFLTVLGVRGQQQQQHEYLGYNVTTASDGDFALCGTNLWGCLSLPSTNARGGSSCHDKAQLGTIDELGTPSQQWMYEDAGLLKPKVQPTRTWYSTTGTGDVCLGPPKGAEALEFGRSYPLTLRNCPDDEDDDNGARHMRFVMVDGRMQSLAPIIVVLGDDGNTAVGTAEEISTPYCMSIDGTVVLQSAGSAITLEPCDSQNRLQQGLESFGTVQPFVYSLQDVWGFSDVVELAFAVNDGHDSVISDTNDTVVLATVTIANQRDEKVLHTLHATTASGILSFNVSDLRGASDDTTSTVTGEYIATLEAINSTTMKYYSVAFSVSEEQPHVRYTCSTTKSSSSLGILVAVAGLVVGIILLSVEYYSCAHQKPTGTDEEETVVEKMDDYDDDDDLVEAPKDNVDHDGDDDNGDSNDDTELVSDQASDQA